MKKKIKIDIKKADGFEEGFAAYVFSPADKKDKVILLNVYATLLSAIEEDINPKDLILEHLMHEFGHAMQEFLGLEMTEELVEKYVESYREKYSGKGYWEQHGKKNLD